MEKGICPLCLRETDLVYSHIIPDFFYKLLKEEDQHYFDVHNKKGLSAGKRQKADRAYLLCAQCDNVKLGEHLEKPLTDFWKNEIQEVIKNKKDTPIIIAKHKEIKNAILSMLWRMDLASQQLQIFEQIKLDDKNRNRIRNIILKNESTSPLEYPIQFIALHSNEISNGHMIQSPFRVRINKNIAYVITIPSLILIVTISKWPIDTKFILSDKEFYIGTYKTEDFINKLIMPQLASQSL